MPGSATHCSTTKLCARQTTQTFSPEKSCTAFRSKTLLKRCANKLSFSVACAGGTCALTTDLNTSADITRSSSISWWPPYRRPCTGPSALSRRCKLQSEATSPISTTLCRPLSSYCSCPMTTRSSRSCKLVGKKPTPLQRPSPMPSWSSATTNAPSYSCPAGTRGSTSRRQRCGSSTRSRPTCRPG